VLAATQTPGTGGTEWFQGTADAVRQYSWLFADVKNKDVEDVVILSGARAQSSPHPRCPAERAPR
jgi:glucose-1-phosphate adenylyltransferase